MWNALPPLTKPSLSVFSFFLFFPPSEFHDLSFYSSVLLISDGNRTEEGEDSSVSLVSDKVCGFASLLS